MSTRTLAITGMTCAHCVTAVTSELTKLPSVQEVSVLQLTAGGISTVQVTSESPLDETAVREAVDEAGYALIDATT